MCNHPFILERKKERKDWSSKATNEWKTLSKCRTKRCNVTPVRLAEHYIFSIDFHIFILLPSISVNRWRFSSYGDLLFSVSLPWTWGLHKQWFSHNIFQPSAFSGAGFVSGDFTEISQISEHLTLLQDLPLLVQSVTKSQP